MKQSNKEELKNQLNKDGMGNYISPVKRIDSYESQEKSGEQGIEEVEIQSLEREEQPRELFSPVQRMEPYESQEKSEEQWIEEAGMQGLEREEQPRKLISPVKRIYQKENKSPEFIYEDDINRNVVDDVIKSISSQSSQTSIEFTRKNMDYDFKLGPFFYSGHRLLVKNESDQCILLGNFWLQITKEEILRTPIVNEQNIQTKIEEKSRWNVRIFCEGKVFDAVMNMKEIRNGNGLPEVTRDRARLEMSAKAKSFFQHFVDLLVRESNYQKEFLYPSLGWNLVDGSYKYLLRNGEIGKSGGPYFADVDSNFHYCENLVGHPEIFRYFLGLRQICFRREKSVFLMHYSCLATLTTLFQDAGFPIKFVTALIGETNSLKTSVGVIFSRMFDRTMNSKPDIRFDSTEVAIAEKMEMYSDSILMVDDLLPYSDNLQRNRQQKKSEIILRGYGDRVPRKRSKTYATINGVSEYNPVRGCCLITGEVLDLEHESTATRVIKIPFERDSVDKERLTYYQKNLYGYTTFMVDFLSYVTENIQLVFQIIQRYIAEIRHANLDMIKVPRFKEIYGIFLAETEIFYTYAKERNFMTEEESQVERHHDLDCIMKIILENQEYNKKQSQAAMICNAMEWAVNNNSKFVIISQQKANVLAKDVTKKDNFLKCSIVNEGEFLGVLPQTLFEIARSYFKYMGMNTRFRNTTELSSAMKKENLIEARMEGTKRRYTLKTSYSLGNRVYLISKTVYRKLCEKIE